ncbi:LysR family transcriptional regulator [Ruminococcus flavefaciens]|uniref:LysR family transcriptional regulator n=1 Tax=Ruminococcus flavefaciens TaxID=1265 RepID=UPI0013DA1FB4|nr:LysR family transcriptional regulator [Ruminococcus flavefaciens]
MNTLHFKYAVEIEKTRSITQAAENLYMAQPNLSKAIKELESTLGITIFRRTSKGVIPTDQGLKFLDYAKQILIQIDNMEAIHSPDKPKNSRLRISVPRTGYISKAFSEYIASLNAPEDMEIFFCETNSLRTIENVRENGYDFGVIRFNTAHEKYFTDFLAEKNLDSKLLWEFEMLAVMSAEHPAAGADSITYADLSCNYTELGQGDDAVPYVSGAVEKLYASNRPADVPVRKVCMYDRGSALDFLLTVPQAFMMDSPMPASLCRKYGLVQRKCAFPDNSYKDVLIYTSGHKLSENELKLVNRLYEVRNESAFAEYK